MSKREQKVTNAEIMQVVAREPNSTGGYVEYKGKLYYRKPFEELMKRLEENKKAR